MRASATAVSGQAFKSLSKGHSSFTLVDFLSYRNPNILVKLQNRVKTNTVLNQTEGLFEDFTRKSFGNQVIQMYEEYKEAVDKNLKIDLINLSSFSIYEMVVFHNGNKKFPLPFKLHENPISAELKQARIFSHDVHNMNALKTWHQITMTITFEDVKTGENFGQDCILERRETDDDLMNWRVGDLKVCIICCQKQKQPKNLKRLAQKCSKDQFFLIFSFGIYL